MATFIYMFRDKNGSIKTGNIDCVSRGEVFSELKRLGIVPIRVECGCHTTRTKAVSRFNGKLSFVFYILASSIIAIICLFLMLNSNVKQKVEELSSSNKTQIERGLPTKKTNKVTKAITKPDSAIPMQQSQLTKGQLTCFKILTDELEPQTRTNKYGRIVKRAKPIPPRKDNTVNFKHVSEAEIAAILQLDTTIPQMVNMPFPPNFTEDLKACLDIPVEILPTDTEHEIEVKKAVEETKKELKARMNAGEDPAKILQETRAELCAVSQYRDQLKQNLRELISDSSKGAQEIHDLIAAANKLLEDKGVPSIKFHPMVIRSMRMRASQKKGQQK